MNIVWKRKGEEKPEKGRNPKNQAQNPVSSGQPATPFFLLTRPDQFSLPRRPDLTLPIRPKLRGPAPLLLPPDPAPSFPPPHGRPNPARLTSPLSRAARGPLRSVTPHQPSAHAALAPPSVTPAPPIGPFVSAVPRLCLLAWPCFSPRPRSGPPAPRLPPRNHRCQLRRSRTFQKPARIGTDSAGPVAPIRNLRSSVTRTPKPAPFLLLSTQPRPWVSLNRSRCPSHVNTTARRRILAEISTTVS